MPRSLLLVHSTAPGDIVAMTACVRDLALNYPGRFDVHVHTTCKTLWENNPYVVGSSSVQQKEPKTDIRLHLDYGKYIRTSNNGGHPAHFVTAFNANLSEQLQLDVPVMESKGDLHLTQWEKDNPPIDGRYWCVMPGGKNDFTTKIWSPMRWQQTLTKLRQFGLRFVQVGALHGGHQQPPMSGTMDLVNRTNLRELLWLLYHADGAICHVTGLMHMAAALDRPCVVIAGGREHWWWEAYVNSGVPTFGPKARPVTVPHRYLHTVGCLDCCLTRGCWRNKILKSESDRHKSYCTKPTDDGYGRVIPKCLDMITVNHVVDAVLSYYSEGARPCLT